MKVKTQIASQASSTGVRVPNAIDVFRDIVRKKGFFRGLFNGLDAQIARDGPFYMFYFGIYDLCRKSIALSFPSVPLELSCFFSGGFAGAVAWALVVPCDGPKSIIQASWDKRVVGDFPTVFAQVFRERGLSGLYAGFGPAVLRAFPVNGACFLGYETARNAVADL